LLRKLLLVGNAFAWSAAMLAMPITVANPVRRDLNLGRADAALQRLDTVLAQNPSDAEAHNFWDQAIADCEAAIRLEPNNSNYHLWLGRAYGQKADHVSLMAGYKLARKVAAEFKQAVQLDPKNTPALSDLGEFDVRAPAMVGGGVNRARAILQQLQNLDPAAALVLQARIAEDRRAYTEAEADYRSAIAKSSDPAQAWMDLASFYRRHGSVSQMIAAARNGAALDQHHGPALVDGATVLASQDPQTAIQWLNDYLNSHAQSEEAPAFAVRAELADLLQKEGDTEGAQEQIAEVHGLASEYRIPASPLNTSDRAGR